MRYEKAFDMKVDGSRERRLKKGSNRPDRAWAVALAACGHVMALMWLGWRVPRLAVPPSEDRRAAIEVTLVRPPVPARARPRAEASRPAPSAPSARAPIPLVPAPAAPPEQSAPVESPQAQAQASPEGQDLAAPHPGLLPSLSGRLGCDDPPGQRLTSEQRQTCYNNAARLAEETRPLAHDIPADKQAAYDHYVFCAKLHRGPMPAPSDNRGLGEAGGKCLMGTW
jgi:hypothetical protein